MQSQVIFGHSAFFLLVLRINKVKKQSSCVLTIAMSEQQPMMSEQTVLWSDKLQVYSYLEVIFISA